MDTLGTRRSQARGLDSSKSPPSIRCLRDIAAQAVLTLDENFCGCGDGFRQSITSIDGKTPYRYKRTGFNPAAWFKRSIRIVVSCKAGTHPARINDIRTQAGIFLEDYLKDFYLPDIPIDLVITELK